jgi:hypothetical protein
MPPFPYLQCLAAFLACMLSAAAGEQPFQEKPPLQLPVPESRLKETRVEWYGVYYDGTKVGWLVDSVTPGVFQGQPCVTFRSESLVDVRAGDLPTKTETVEVIHYSATPPHRALFLEGTERMLEQQRHVILRHEKDDVYRAEITEAGQTRTRELSGVECFFWQNTTPEVWATDASRKAGDSISVAHYDLEKFKMMVGSLSITRGTHWVAPGGRIPVWELSWYYPEQEFRGKGFLSRTSGEVVSAQFGPMMEFRLEPEKIAKSVPNSGDFDVFAATMISVDGVLPESESLAELVIEITAPDGKELPLLPDTANQTVEKSPGSLTVRIAPGRGKPQRATEQERADALKPTMTYPIEEPVIKELAARAVEGAKTDRDKVAKLVAFTDDYIRDSEQTEPLTVMDLLKRREGDCSAHSLLFTTLARAAGLPSRQTIGWLYMGDAYKSFGSHAWNEVILDGVWTAVDPIWGQTEIDAGHLQEGLGIESMISGLKAKVISFKKNSVASGGNEPPFSFTLGRTFFGISWWFPVSYLVAFAAFHLCRRKRSAEGKACEP